MNNLAAAVSQVESANFPYAMRFEAGLFAHPPSWVASAIPAAERFNRCNEPTARMLCCTSFGLFQILGCNIYGMLARQFPVATFLWDAGAQMDAFADFCAHHGINTATFDGTDQNELENFARVYNGPGAIPDYSAKLKSAFAALTKGDLT